MAHAIRIHETGGSDVLRYEEVATDALPPGSARVRHLAIGVNFIDVYHRSGLYPLPSLPHGLGVEAAGVVEEIGEGVTGVRTGDRVAYVSTVPGTYAEVGVVPASRLVPLPDGISERDAAASLLKGMTVEYLIRRTFPVKAGMPVLWHAAAGGVGLLACQWLAHLGAVVIGTVSSREKAELAAAHGCAHPIVYTEEDFPARVRAITNDAGVPVVYDSVGRDTFEGSLSSLARRGMLVSFGNASGAPKPFDALELSRRGSLYLTRPTLFDYTATREELLASANAVFDVLAQGVVKVHMGDAWPLADAAAAHEALESRRSTGSLLLLP